MSGARLLFVEDEEPFRRFAGRLLAEQGFVIDDAAGAEQALQAFERATPDLVLLDLNLPDLHGLEVLRRLRQRQPALKVVVLTAYGDAQNAVAAMKAGATDYLTKPIRLDRLVEAVKDALAAPPVAAPAAASAAPAEAAARPGEGEARPAEPPTAVRRLERARREAAAPLLGGHPRWLEAIERLERVARSNLSGLLLLGESGTGKSLLARRFHELSERAAGPFVQIDCPSIPEALLESELFGHERGAFTGASARKRGQLETAQGGTLFLDEVGELPLTLQPKLLRFLEQRRFRRVGGLEDLEADVRLVCATNRDLQQDVENGLFRADLFYRLEVVAIWLPPLRERGDDVVAIARSLAEQFAAETGRAAPSLSPEAEAALRSHPFAGNLRELRNMVQRAVTFLAGDVISVRDLELGSGRLARQGQPPAAPQPPPAEPGTGSLPLPVDLERLLQALEAHYIELALTRTGSQREAGALVNLDRFAVARRLARAARLGGPDGARRALGQQPEWVRALLGPHPGPLPEPGIDLPALLRDLEERLIAAALAATEGNRARAATLLGMSRTSLGRRLDGREGEPPE